MDLQFPHHECEIAQSAVCNHHIPARYWLHNNMITINGKKMGKSYNNVIKLSELFSGNSPVLEQAYTPMTIRFFILQTHYRSTLDFSNEALQAAERGLKRLWEAFGNLQKMDISEASLHIGSDVELNAKCLKLLEEADEFMSDDFNTAKVLANFFELVPVINSIRDGHLSVSVLDAATLVRMQKTFQTYLIDIFGLKEENAEDTGKLSSVMQLLIDIRKEARSKKDFMTSDKIRNQLQEMGIQLKDEKDGAMSWTLSAK
jgi:cysteinyl-tRNA synthetase